MQLFMQYFRHRSLWGTQEETAIKLRIPAGYIHNWRAVLKFSFLKREVAFISLGKYLIC